MRLTASGNSAAGRAAARRPPRVGRARLGLGLAGGITERSRRARLSPDPLPCTPNAGQRGNQVPPLSNAKQFPVAARAGFAHVRNKRDLITSKLAPLHLYQLSLPVPHSKRSTVPPPGVAKQSSTAKDAAPAATCPGVQRRRLEPPHRRGDLYRQLSIKPLTDPPLPNHSATRDRREDKRRLLPRRPVSDPARGGRPLRHLLQARRLIAGEDRPRPIPARTLGSARRTAATTRRTAPASKGVAVTAERRFRRRSTERAADHDLRRRADIG